MKAQISLFVAALALVSFALTSCNKDKENPEIEIVSPAQHTHFDRGSIFDVEIKFKDDRELKSYTMEMANSDGSHNHMFHFSESGDITGSETSMSTSITVPSTAPDVLWLYVTATDEEGKTTEMPWMLHFDN